MTPKMSNILKSVIVAASVASLMVACGNHNRGFRPKKRNTGIEGLGKGTPQELARGAQDQLTRQLVAKALMGRSDADIQNAALLSQILPESAAGVILGTKASIARVQASPSLATANMMVTTPSETGSGTAIQATISSVVGSAAAAKSLEVTGQFEPGSSYMDQSAGGVQFKAACYENCKSLLVLVTANEANAAYMFSINQTTGVGTIIGSSLGSRLKSYDEAMRLANVETAPNVAPYAPDGSTLTVGQTIAVPVDAAAQPVAVDPLASGEVKTGVEEQPAPVATGEVKTGVEEQPAPVATGEVKTDVEEQPAPVATGEVKTGVEEQPAPAAAVESGDGEFEVVNGVKIRKPQMGGDLETNAALLAQFQVGPGATVSAEMLDKARAAAKSNLNDHFAALLPVFGLIFRTQDEATEIRPFFILKTFGGNLISEDGEGPAEEQSLDLNKDILGGKVAGAGVFNIPGEGTNTILDLSFICHDSCRSIDILLGVIAGEIVSGPGGKPQIKGRAVGHAVYRFKAVQDSEIMNLEYTSAGLVLPPSAMADFSAGKAVVRQCMESARALDERLPCVQAAGQDEVKVDACLAKKGAEKEEAECIISGMKAMQELVRPVNEAAFGTELVAKQSELVEQGFARMRAQAKELAEMKPRLTTAEQPAPVATGEVKTGDVEQPAPVTTNEFRDLSKERGTTAK
ncbi:MAG: hypothetical protein H6624_16010 [Bdellovibrionaceae bacterium]|nr:hypothetical protein [Bdellovibrionales bacterium]MCB9085853.1 hypothetical protein [Pseudobdellovibrionaceae bacterium]